MRHSFSAWIALAGALCLASCARETVEVRERFSYESTILVDCGETRTANTGSGTTWVADDAISAIHTDASDPNFYASRFYYSGEGNAFRGSVTDAAEYNDWYLVYPYRENNTDASQIHVTVENTAEQVGNDDRTHLAGEGFPLVGKKTQVEGRDIRMSMGQVLTILQIKVVNDRFDPIVVKEITVAVPHEIAGHFVGDLTPESVEKTKDIAWTAEGNNSKNLTLTVKDGEEILNQDAMFYIGAMPFTLKAGESIKVKITAVDKATNNELTFYKTFKRDVDMDFPAGEMSQQLKNSFDYDPEDYQDPDPEGPVVKENQTLTFANASLTLTLGDVYAVGGTYDFPQTVEGAKTPVTYTSLNTDVITIVDNSKIHIAKAGTATIKASADEDDTYNAAEATYTLTVTEAAVAPSQRTYKYDSSKSSFSSSDAGTYLIMGYESSTSGNSAVGTYVCPFPANSEGKLPHVKVSDSSSITEYTTSDPAIIAYEVELSQHTVSGTTGWVVFVKANNKYLYYDGSALAFTSNKDEAVHSISKGSSKAWSIDKTSGSSTVEFYHSGSNQDFRYRSNQNADNLKLFKLDASKNSQSIAFSSSQFTYTLGDTYYVGGTYNLPQVSAVTPVTYSTTNTDVLTISGTTFTILKAGTATITASAAETDSYYGATATTTIVINPASVTPVTSSAYVKVTEEPSRWDGTYLIVDESSSKAFAAFSENASSYAVNVTISNGQVAATNDVAKYAFTISDAGVNHENSNFSGQRAYHLRNSEGKYIFGSSSSVYIGDTNQKASQSSSSSTMNTYYSVFKYSGSGVQVASAVQSSGSYAYYLGYSDNAFGYAGGSSVSDSDKARRVQLYKLGEGSTSGKLPRNLQFAQNTVTVSQATGTTLQVQALTGEKNGVEYSSTNSNIATVNGTTITIQGYGSTTIIAQASENDVYAAGTASYTLVVNDPSAPSVNAYVKVTSEPQNWAGTYLFVDESSSKAFAAFSTNASSYAVNVTISNGQIAATSEIAKYALTVTDAGVQHANASGQEAYDVRNSDGKYIYYSSSALQIADTNSKTDSGSSWGGSWGGSSTTTTYYYYHAFKYNNNGVQVLSSRHDSGSNKYYLGYVNSAFSYSNSSADGRRVQLYKLQSSGGSSSGKQNQSPYFANDLVSQTMATASGTLQVQAVQGAQGTVTYSSSESSVATVSGTTITIHGFGSTVITASAAGNDSYNPGSASYTLTIVQSGSSTASIYQKASSITVGGTYLIVDVADQRLMKGDSDGSFVSVSPSNGVITDSNNSLSGYEFTVTQSGSKYCIKKGDQYLLCDYSNNGNSTTGLTYVNQEPASNYLYSLSVSNSVFEFSTDQRNSTSTNQVLYYKTSSNLFKIGGSGVGVGVHLYLKTSSGSGSGKQNQSPYFANALVSQTMATASGTLQVQAVQGAQGTVTYSSSEPSVATVSGTTITIHGFGSTVITASAAGNSNYNPGSASYTLTIVQSGSSSGSGVYVKATALTVGGTYLITDVADQRLFKGASDGSYVSVSPSGGVITDNNGTMSAYEFTVSQSGSKYCLIFNDGKYLICDYSNSGNTNTGLTYLTSKPADNYLYTYTVNNGAFEFKTEQRNSSEQKLNEVLYFKTSSDLFKIGGSGVGVGVHLYLKESGSTTTRQQQSLYFSNTTVNWTLGTDGNVNSVKTGQSVQNAKTSPVTYTSSDSSVATVSGTQITIKGAGTTIITATAPMDNSWFEGTASYTLNILPASGVMVYNLENDSVKDYFNYVEQHPYDPSDYSYSYVTNYTSGRGQNNRLDWPKPVPVSWSNPSSGNGSKVVYIYNNSAMTDEEMHVSVSSSSATSANVYNLIPGHTYYYKVTNNGSTLTTGTFMTSGRRRMMNVSSNYNQNNANNCRDLGGQVTTNNNKTVKYGLIYRGSNMDSVPNDANAKSVLLDYMKISLDVDLRERSYNSGQSPLGSNVQLSDKNYNSMSDLTNASNMGVTLNDIFTAVAAGKHVYIHCAVGADRTGFVCMVLEGLLGVPQNMCDVDFELTSFSVVGTRQRTANSNGNYYYSGSGGNGYMGGGDKGVTYINNNYSGSTFQEKVTAFVKSMMKNANLGLSDTQISQKITQFQNDMLE